MPDISAARTRMTRAESKDQTHRMLLDAAERVFVRLGYQGATLDAIAAEAGFTKGAVYWHFKNKEALFLELLADGMKRNADEAQRILTILEQYPERLDEVLGEWFDRFDANNKVPLLGLELDLEARRNASFAAMHEQVIAEQRQGVTRFLDQYFKMTKRDAPMPLDELAATMIALSKTVALARQTRHSANLTAAKAVRILLGMPVSN